MTTERINRMLRTKRDNGTDITAGTIDDDQAFNNLEVTLEGNDLVLTRLNNNGVPQNRYYYSRFENKNNSL